MSEKRYKFGIIKGSRQAHIIDCHTCKSATIDVYDDNIKYVMMNDILWRYLNCIDYTHYKLNKARIVRRLRVIDDE